jgi:hypothetical protein
MFSKITGLVIFVKLCYDYYVIWVRGKMETSNKLRETEERSRVWRELVKYANGSDDPDEGSLNALRAAFFLSQRELPIEIPLQDVSEVHRYQKAKQISEEESFRFWATKYLPDFRKLLTWLCLPNERPVPGSSFGFPSTPAQFLQAHSSSVRWDFEHSYEDFDETGENGYPIFLWATSNGCDSIMGPICKFILERIWQFQEGPLRLHEAIPIRICEREGCGKFLVPARADRKKFCSKECLQLSHPPRSGDENRDYMRVYRLEREPPSVRRKKLASTKWRTRLADIEKNRPALTERVQKLRKAAKA